MSNYRRLISYIYAYEGGVKGKNIGFAKLEARNGQCKIQVNVKKVYMGNHDLGIYLLSGEKEIFLGNIFIRNGGGEFRTVVQVGNVEQSGCHMDSCYGMTIHEKDNSWQTYTTIWEDAVTQAAEIELAEVTSEKRREQEQERSLLEEKKREKTTEQEVPQGVPKISGESQEQQLQEEILSEEQERQLRREITSEIQVQESQLEVTEKSQEQQLENIAESQKEPLQPEHFAELEIPVEHMEAFRLEQIPPFSPAEEDQEEAMPHLWETMRKEYPKIMVFDYADGCEILTIKPQDIGLLPRETWVYGNNSFLLHGYYHYRYLILVRLNHPQGNDRYLLGVPGHYYQNEKYMASMFGFPHFVLSREQPMKDGRFGYWYTDINLESRTGQ